MEVITYILLNTIAFIITYFIRDYFIKKVDKNILKVKNNGPKSYPVIGNAYICRGTLQDVIKRILEENKKFTSPWRLYIGPKLCIILDNPQMIKAVFGSSSAIEKSNFYNFLKTVLGDGLITTPAIRWKNNRKKLRHMFIHKTINNYLLPMVKSSLTLLEIFDSANGKKVNVSRPLFLCTFDIICGTLLGTKDSFQKDPECKIYENVASLTDSVMYRILKLWLYPDFIYYNTSAGKEFKKCLSSVNNFAQQIIEREALLKREFKDEASGSENEGEIKTTFLDILFDLSKEFKDDSEKYIRDEIYTLIAAGSETTSGTISFVLLMLATYPDIQEKAYEELFEIYGTNDPQEFPILHDDIKNMRYLELVIKETLRLFPAVPIIGRRMSDDVKVNEEITIPKNSDVFCLIIELHRNSKYWNDPLRFNPDRFLSGNYNPDNFIPFSIGRRDCIGRHLAMLETKIILANILRKFVVKLDHPRKIEDIDVVMSVSLKPSEPILLRFVKR